MKKNKCEFEKNRFSSVLIRIFVVFGISIALLLTLSFEKEKYNEVINSFNNGNELMCNSNIVSKSNGYKLNIENETINNGSNIFLIRNCRLK